MGNEQVAKEVHDRFGGIVISEEVDEDGETYEDMEFSQPVENQKAFETWKKNLLRVEDSLTREVLLLPKKYSYETVGMCGSRGLVTMKFDYYPHILENEIANRRQKNSPFLETEMWYLLYNMIRTANKFEKLKAKIGNVHPSNVVINSNGHIKLISTVSLLNEVDNFTRLVEDPKAQVYLAPEELANDGVSRGEYPHSLDPARAEVFSIGMTILSSGTLDTLAAVYCLERGTWKLSRNHLANFLKKLSENYKPHLCSIVGSMLAENPHERRKASDIYQSLYEFEDRILDLEEFQPLSTRISYSSNNVPFSGYQERRPPGVYQPVHFSQPAGYLPYSPFPQVPAYQQVMRPREPEHHPFYH